MTTIGIRHRQAANDNNRFVELRIPLPPPLSACFTNNGRGGRVKTRRYNAWLQLATAKTVPPPPLIKGPVGVIIQVTPPDKRKRDLDNLLKATLDFLTKRPVIEDDSLIESLFMKWHREGEPGLSIMVTAKPEAK